MLKIVFVSHDATRTGAPILLINLIRLLKDSGKYEFSILLKNGGELENRFIDLGETYIWNKRSDVKRSMSYRLVRLNRHERLEQKRKSDIVTKIQKSDIILNNTITNGELLSIIAKGYTGRIITYVHELRMAFIRFASPEGISQTLDNSHKIAVPSKIVGQHLMHTFSTPADKISYLNYYIPGVNNSKTFETDAVYKKKVLTVGGCGTTDWRKGFDIFIDVLIYLKYKGYADLFKFIWKGAKTNSITYEECMHDIKKAGVEKQLQLIVADNNVEEFYKNIDVLFLSSREDPYPLIVLEAASFSKPVICFKEAGGAPEFVQLDAGSIIEYLDISQVAEELLKYHFEQILIYQKGKVAFKRVKELHHDKAFILEQFKELIGN